MLLSRPVRDLQTEFIRAIGNVVVPWEGGDAFSRSEVFGLITRSETSSGSTLRIDIMIRPRTNSIVVNGPPANDTIILVS